MDLGLAGRVAVVTAASREPGPMGDPADFGAVVAFLCSRQAAFVNATTLVVDGGSTLGL